MPNWLAAAEGDASGMWFGSVFGDIVFPNLFVRGQYAAAASVDAEAAQDYFAAHGPDEQANFAYAATSLGWGGGLMADSWPEAAEVDKYSTVRTSDVETLIVNGELDFARPPQNATEQLLPFLPNGHEVVLPEFGHVLSFYTEHPEAGTHLITEFFDSGRVDDSLYRPQKVDFTPSTTTPATAKLLLGVMPALAALAVLSLVGMWARTRRAAFGPVSGVLLRSVYLVVLGLGGWSLGVLIVLATMPGVTINNELLAVLGVAVPVALGLFFAWVRPGGSARPVGLAMAIGGAALGGWLGFHATEGILTVVTTILGALAGSNLALVGLDITRDHLATRRPGLDQGASRSTTQPSGVRL